ncbi:hypothetical protein NHX12_033265 [Muraenolepis orangiensis]|uniref:Plasmalemma vesicle-associated protein n=1 Tax=Muraenolepis orangiensis TaxID=630683 RepID=A0A9Q0E243_9TELE|nr:hypothetical protein NHX12_033265 [Muraenolepis orangiensis]
MYSTSYSRAKLGLDAREPLHKPRGKSCGYYMRIVFFFSSLIQSLIIASLVLFLVYGQPEKSAEEMRVKDLEQSFNQLSGNNLKLRKEKGELGAQLGARTAEKAALEKEVEKLKTAANATAKVHLGMLQKLAQCEEMKRLTLLRCSSQAHCPSTPLLSTFSVCSSELKTLQSLNAQQRAMINLIGANFTQTVQYLSHEKDDAVKERDAHNQDAITTRQENIRMQEQLTLYTRKCKEDFSKSLEGIQTVTSGFLARINSLFPHHLTFQLTCEKQQQQMDKIRTSCTNLSREVEDRFQKYLNSVATIQSHSSRLEVQSAHLTSELQTCERSRAGMAEESSKLIQTAQQTHDTKMRKILVEQNHLRDDKKLQAQRLALTETEAQVLRGRIQALTALPNCKLAKPPLQQSSVTKQVPGSG